MTGSTDTTQPPQERRTFGTGEMRRNGQQPVGPVRRELLGQPAGVDAFTAELRQRIAAASRVNLIGSLLLRR